MGAALDYFNENVYRETDDCIVWKHNINHKGYGLIYLDKKIQIVHGAALRLRLGEKPADKPLCLHKPVICHNRACFNYRHLYWGDYKDNRRDQVLDGSHTAGENHPLAKLNDVMVRAIRLDNRNNQEIANSYKVSRTVISKIKLGKLWKTVR
jgi:hypothetical protein